VLEGSEAELLNNPAVQAAYLGKRRERPGSWCPAQKSVMGMQERVALGRFQICHALCWLQSALHR
jgi:hypothetical protein